MTATCSQRKFLEAVKKFHCCPFSRVVFMSHIAFFILLFLFGETKDEAEPTRRGASAHNKREPPKNAKNKVALFIAQPNTTTIAITRNKGLTLDFRSSTGASTLRRGKRGGDGIRGEGRVSRLNQSLPRRFHIGMYSVNGAKLHCKTTTSFQFQKSGKICKNRRNLRFDL